MKEKKGKSSLRKSLSNNDRPPHKEQNCLWRGGGIENFGEETGGRGTTRKAERNPKESQFRQREHPMQKHRVDAGKNERESRVLIKKDSLHWRD